MKNFGILVFLVSVFILCLTPEKTLKDIYFNIKGFTLDEQD